MKKRIFPLSLFMILIFSTNLLSEIEPSNTPENTQSYNLNDIYNRLDTGEVGSQSYFSEPTAGPGATGRTINEIMTIAPAVHGNPADASEVVDGKYFWSLISGDWGLTEGTRALSPVPKTGLTSSQHSGDDGDLEKGLPWPDPRFTDNGNGTVTDNLTGLIWLKNADCIALQPWGSALLFCNTLNNGECGLTDGSSEGDWRLPNIKEILSLFDYGSYDPTLPTGHPFQNVRSAYWSSTNYSPEVSSAFLVNFYNGAVEIYDTGYQFYVWPVRDEL